MATVVVFDCPTDDCTAKLTVGLDRLVRSEPITCYACGAHLEATNPQLLVDASREALAAITRVAKVLRDGGMPFCQVKFTSHCVITTDDALRL